MDPISYTFFNKMIVKHGGNVNMFLRRNINHKNVEKSVREILLEKGLIKIELNYFNKKVICLTEHGDRLKQMLNLTKEMIE